MIKKLLITVPAHYVAPECVSTEISVEDGLLTASTNGTIDGLDEDLWGEL